MDDLKELHRHLMGRIQERLAHFDSVWTFGGDRELFMEMAFCLFTPQSRATACWPSVQALEKSGLLWQGNREEIAAAIPRVRFRNNKAGYLVRAREHYLSPPGLRARLTGDDRELRDRLAAEVKGYGMKEASHFLRNIGRGRSLAILDRHIIKHLAAHEVIEIFGAPTGGRYREAEVAMEEWCKTLNIPMADMDMLLWYLEAGEIYK